MFCIAFYHFSIILIHFYLLLLLDSVLGFPALVSRILCKPAVWLLSRFNWLIATWCGIWVWGFSKQITNSFTCVYMCVYMCLYVCVCLNVCACKCGYMCICICVYVCVCMCLCICMYLYIYVYVCMYVYMHIYIFHCLTFKLLLCCSFAGIFWVRFSLDGIYQF